MLFCIGKTIYKTVIFNLSSSKPRVVLQMGFHMVIDTSLWLTLEKVYAQNKYLILVVVQCVPNYLHFVPRLLHILIGAFIWGTLNILN